MSDDIKSCCANFYQSDAARMLLGDVFHPGGLALTHHLGEVVDLTPDSRVLDVACGRGASAVHLAESFGCYVTGVDYGEENVAAAKELAAERGVPHLTAFRVGDAEGLPVESGVFDAVVSECSFCTFPDKAAAAREFVRVLLPGGHLGLTDMTLDGPLPEDIPNLLAWVSCVAGAQKVERYVEGLAKALDVPVILWDERFSTVSAERLMREAGLRGRKKRERIDAVAAAVILQDYLDSLV